MTDNVFIHALENFATEFDKVSGMETQMLAHKDKLKSNLESLIRNSNFAIADSSDLSNSINQLKKSIQEAINSWDQKLSDLRPMQQLSEQYADRVIFLIFGKVNTGKSSFANFITEQFPPDQIKRFYFENGEVHYFQNNQRFAEGVTETTATIQGVELGKNFVLLDSPGLHSVTAENGALTQQFIDGTDAVLWLTPSTSPGQTQELNDLKIELEKGKPLQPVITRSDLLEEDYCERTDDIITIVKNKTPENRQLQEKDVLERLSKIPGISSVKKPISISVHAYIKGGKTPIALQEAGLTSLLAEMVALVDEAKRYKVEQKAKQQMIEFLDKKILESLECEIKHNIDSLSKKSKESIDKLNQQKELLVKKLSRDISCKIPDIINKHKHTKNTQAIVDELNQIIANEVDNALQQVLSEFIKDIKTTSISLLPNELGKFEDITIDITQLKGSGAKSVSTGIGSLGGTAGGAALGSMLGPIGTVVGGLLGGLFGGAVGSVVGDNFLETEYLTETVGVSSENMIDQTTRTIQEKKLPQMIEKIFKDAIRQVTSVQELVDEISTEINGFRDEIEQLKGVK